MQQIALCDTCRHQHLIEFDPAIGGGSQYSDWVTKHAGHVIRFMSPRRSRRDRQMRGNRYERYIHNADVKISYGASAAPTLTLASLAASSSLLAGRESSAIDNGTNKYLDYLFAGHYKAGAANNQAGSVLTCVVGAMDDTPTWPAPFDGTDSVETVGKQGNFDSICRVISSIAADNTADQVWEWGPVGIAGFFSGALPDQFVLFITQNIQTSTNVWSATEGDHAVKFTPIFLTVA